MNQQDTNYVYLYNNNGIQRVSLTTKSMHVTLDLAIGWPLTGWPQVITVDKVRGVIPSQHKTVGTSILLNHKIIIRHGQPIKSLAMTRSTNQISYNDTNNGLPNQIWINKNKLTTFPWLCNVLPFHPSRDTCIFSHDTRISSPHATLTPDRSHLAFEHNFGTEHTSQK